MRAHMVEHCPHVQHPSGRGAAGPPLFAGEPRRRMVSAAPLMGRAQRVGNGALGVLCAPARLHSALVVLVYPELLRANYPGDSRQSFRVQQDTGWGCALRLHGESPFSIVELLCAAVFASCQCASWPVPSSCDFLSLLLLEAAALLFGAAASMWILAALARVRALACLVASTHALLRLLPFLCMRIRAHAGEVGGGGVASCGLEMRGRLGLWLGCVVGVFRMLWSGLECGCHMAARSEVTRFVV